MELYPLKIQNRKEENCMLVVVLRQGTKSLGPAQATGSSCAGQPGAWGSIFKVL